MKKILIIIFFTITIFTQYSCKKDLNALPDQAKVDGNVIVDQKSAEVALNGAYYRLAEGGDDRGTPSVKLVTYHEILPSWAAGNLAYRYGPGPLTENRLTSQSSEAVRIWSTAYLLINAANGVIKGVEALDDAKITAQRKKEIVAEARFLRAYGHYRLLSFYSQYYDINSKYGVMLRKEFVTLDNISLPRSTVAESYTFILQDIDEAIANAPVANKAWYVSQWAAKALKARVLMNRGAAGDYAKVIALTEDIIQHSPFRLENHTRDIFSTLGLDSKEIILGVTPLPNQSIKNLTYAYYTPTNSLTGFLQGDPRENWMLGDVYGLGTGIIKYKGPKNEVSYLFRLTEMYLLQAEAIVRSGGNINGAKTLLKTVMGHADITDFTPVDNANTPDAFLIVLYKELVKNMLCEDGQDWFALLRFPLAIVTSLRPTITSVNQFIFPIPHTEFIKNSALGDQNPGYEK